MHLGKQSTTYTPTHDAENGLTGVSGGASASFTYDAEGTPVKRWDGQADQTTVYVGELYQKNTDTGQVTKYYYFESRRVAVRIGGTPWLLVDHLGSSMVLVDWNGDKWKEQWYSPFGEKRYPSTGDIAIDRRFTGQRWDATIDLYDYQARYYDPALGRFVQPDTMVPELGNPQSLNRYAYVYNNPLRYTDPSGHCPWCISILVGTATDVAIDFLIAKATGTEFNLVDSLKVNAGINVVTLGVGGKVAKLRHLGKVALLAKGAAQHGDEAAKLARAGAKVAEELAEEAAERVGKESEEEAIRRFVRHHIATNKNWIRDPQWSKRFQELFARAGMSLDEAANIMEFPAEFHKGPHAQAYHRGVYRRLQDAIAGLDDPVQIRAALEAKLRAIAEELRAHPEWLRNPPVEGGP